MGYLPSKNSAIGWRSQLVALLSLTMLASGLLFAPAAGAQEREAAEEATDEYFVRCTTPPDGMTAWWGFERVQKGKQVPDLTDTQPVGKMKKKAKRVNGPVGAAVQFKGSRSHVRVPRTDLGIGEGDFSIDFWIKTTETDRTPDVVFDNRSNRSSGFHVYTWKGRPGLQVGGKSFTAPQSGFVADGEWHFVAMTADSSAGKGTIYVDGKKRKSFDFPTGWNHEGPAVSLGKKLKLGGNETMTGSLDEVEVFNRLLSQQEVTDIFEAGGAGKCRVTIDETKALLAEALGGVDEDVCKCVLINLLRAYDGDLNRLYRDLESSSARLSRLLEPILERCNETPPRVCVTPPRGMVGWYPFDEAGEQILPDGLPDATNTNAGSDDGKVNNAATFNGQASYTVENPGEAFGSTDFAIDFWMKTSDNRRGAISVFDNRATKNGNQGFSVYTFRGRVGLVIDGTAKTSKAKFTDDKWHLVAVSYDSATKTASFYVDGTLEDTLQFTGTLASADGGSIVIGNSNHGGNSPYRGQLDELELFNTQLTQAAIRSIYRAGPYGKCRPEPQPTCVKAPPGMIGWYPFDDGGGTQLVPGAMNSLEMNNMSFAEGKVSGAASFNGSSSIGIANSNSLFGEGDFAIDFWMATGDTRTGALSIFDNRAPNDLRLGFQVFTFRGAIGLQVAGDNYISKVQGIKDSQWHFVAISYDASAGTATFYFDNVVTDTFTITTPPLQNDGGPIVVGNSNIRGNSPFAGVLDELELFNDTLSAADVEAIFLADKLGKCKG